jgi:hypothetical protein
MPSDSSRWQMASAIPLSSVEWLKAFGVRRLAFGVRARPRIRPRGVMMEYWNVEVLRLLRIASRDRGMRLIA